jgi:nitrite reductase/ring-hydroxylating ferredoxin subunit
MIFREFIEHNMNVGAQYKDWITKSEVDSFDQIPIGSGAILRKGFGKIAVYRDPSGNICEYSAICPHMKAIVRWNDDEKSWYFEAYCHQ